VTLEASGDLLLYPLPIIIIVKKVYKNSEGMLRFVRKPIAYLSHEKEFSNFSQQKPKINFFLPKYSRNQKRYKLSSIGTKTNQTTLKMRFVRIYIMHAYMHA